MLFNWYHKLRRKRALKRWLKEQKNLTAEQKAEFVKATQRAINSAYYDLMRKTHEEIN